MPTQVPIEVFMIGKTQVDHDEVDRWMKFIGANEFVLPDDEEITNPAALIALAAKRCYMSFEVGLNPNVTQIRKDYADYFDNILKSGHGSVLEHAVYNFAIENVSRVFTAEMNRHRAGWAISEGSLRFIRFGENIPYWVPTSIEGEDDPLFEAGDIMEYLLREDERAGNAGEPRQKAVTAYIKNQDLVGDLSLEERKQLSRRVFASAFADQESHYRLLSAIWDMDESDKNFAYKKKVTSMMRRIVGLGVATGGVWSGNIRALRHVITMRASVQAEEEILLVFSKIAKRIRDTEPMLFGDFTQTPEGFWVPAYRKV